MTNPISPAKVHLGGLETAEELRLAQLETLKTAVEGWAKKKGIWYDSGWKVPHEHKSYRPGTGDILYMYSDSELIRMIEGPLESEFRRLIDKHGFFVENIDGVTLSFIPNDEALIGEFHRIRRWQWVRGLSKRRLYDIHREVFEHFADSPETLAGLDWRQYEEFLDAIFRNQGYRTELGTGGNDGGVDIRLYQNEAIPELVTLVQAKRYRGTPIKQDAVASLFGVAVEQKAHKGIFATTSRFQPKAKAFAKSVQGRVGLPSIELADSSRVGEWCAHIAKTLDQFFAGDDSAPVPPVTIRPPTELTGRIVVGHRGFNMVVNTFAVIETDFPYEVILRVVGSRQVSGDGQQGTEIAALDSSPRGERILAFKHFSEFETEGFWDGRELFSLWDGTPQRFNYCD